MKKYLIILLIALSINAYSQEQVSLSILQDVRLATFGDNKGNNAFTVNTITRIKMQGNQSELGYLVVYPEWEYANLKQVYNRYSANVGYTFNQLFLDNLEASLIGSVGMIQRGSESSSSFGITGEIGYNINNWFKIVTDGQYNQRSDLNKWLLSGFLGVEFKIL